MLTTRVFRLFVSSTFSDFIAEREALQKEVFPELEKYCAKNGARFQAVGLRWGITEEAQREHDTMRIVNIMRARRGASGAAGRCYATQHLPLKREEER